MKYLDTLEIRDIKNARVSYSSLKEFAKSPIDFLKYINKDFETTPQMVIGSVTDCLLLENDKFDERYMEIPKVDRRTKLGKEMWAEIQKELVDKKLEGISSDDLNKCKMMVEAIKSNPSAAYLLNHTTEVQKELSFKEKKDGEEITVRGILDGCGSFDDDRKFIFDLKTTNDCSPEYWSNTILKWKYHLQAAIYYRAMFKSDVWVKPEFYHIVVENVEPFKVYVFKLSPEMIQAGTQEFEKLIDSFFKCMINNEWHEGTEFYNPGYYEATLPKWFK